MAVGVMIDSPTPMNILGIARLTNPRAMPANDAEGSPEPMVVPVEDGSLWTAEAEKELKKIPFFVRGKARRNTEKFAESEGRAQIDLDTLYDAKAHYAR